MIGKYRDQSKIPMEMRTIGDVFEGWNHDGECVKEKFLSLRQLHLNITNALADVPEGSDPQVIIAADGANGNMVGTPGVGIAHAGLGFDWDSGIFILMSNMKLKV